MDAETVLAAATDAALAEFDDDLIAVYTIGSLAHGGFAPAVSDIDLALVLRRTGADTPARVRGVVAVARERAPGEPAERLSVFWADPERVRSGGDRPARLPAVDRLDLIDSGRLRYGADVRDGAVRPGRIELVCGSAAFLAERSGDTVPLVVGDPEDLLHGGVRRVTKTVLFPVRFLHTLRTAGIGRNDAAVASYADARGPRTALATAALEWRSGSLGDRVAARELLTAHLPGLYRECVDAHLTALPSGDPSVPVLRSMRGALDVGGV